MIILTYNEQGNIRACLDGVFSQRIELPCEVIVVDSGSTDATVRIAREYDVRLFAIERASFSHGRTRQFACEQARGDYLVTLVADAAPADEDWLRSLVDAVADDDMVAGAYSRQLPRAGAGAVETHKLKNRRTGTEERVVHAVDSQEDYRSKQPRERMAVCGFDDVSSCRKRTVWEKIPIPDTPWAEDLAWSKQALMQGYRVVFEPKSAVYHSHAETLWHSFRRAYLDQSVLQNWFGVIFYADIYEAWQGFRKLFTEQQRAILTGSADMGSRLLEGLQNPLRLLFEISGAVLASRPRRKMHTHIKLASKLGSAGFYPKDSKQRIMKTRFALGCDSREVVFMNPDSAALFTIEVPERAKLVFGTALNPQVQCLRHEPVRFIAGIDSVPVYDKYIGAAAPGVEPVWDEVEIDLTRWAGRRVRLSLITRADNTDYAWAGWGGAKIVTPELTLQDRLYNALLDAAHKKATGTPLRHP